MTRARLAMLLLTVLGLTVLTGAGLAPPPGVGAGGEPGEGAHSWMAVEETGAGWRLVHLPPRGFGSGASGAGEVRPAVSLESPPTALVADGTRVYLIYQGERPAPAEPGESGPTEPDPIDSPARVRVYSLRAVPVIGGLWAFDPVGRFDSHPFLTTERPVAGAATDSRGRLVLLLEGDAQPAQLQRLDGETWNAIPTDAIDPGSRVLGFGSTGEGIGLLVGGESPSVWTEHASGPDQVTGFGRTQTLDPARLGGLVAVAFFGQRVAWATRDGDSLRVWSSRAGQAHQVATIGEMDGELSIAPIRVGGGRLAILERVSKEGAAAEFRFVEVSLATGEVLYDGPPAHESPVSPGEFRMLAFSLVLFMSVVLLLTFRPGLDPSAIVIPAGTALADPGRRLVASGLDFLLASIGSSALTGVGLGSLLTGLVILEPGQGWVAIPTTLVLGMLGGTVCESLFAWTPGKLLTGCRVIRLGPEARRLTVYRAFKRNVIKWFTPPIAALAMLDPQTRHRGDDLARAVVVVQAEDPPGKG